MKQILSKDIFLTLMISVHLAWYFIKVPIFKANATAANSKSWVGLELL